MFFAIPYFLLELYLSLKTGETIGFFWSVIWIVTSMIVGVILLQNSPHAVIGNMQAMQKGKLDIKKFQDASMSYFVGAILLIIPGVLSDFLGLMALGYTMYLRFVAKITPEQTKFKRNKGDDNVIDVEIIDEHSDRIDHP
ncbi:FxsA family protein [Sulfurovum sp.]|uniref:FxsA family protein n=1 Tax=Sulfurovum sp. TaxID=1969726 RepID=UPI0025CED65F|nr:FxsA family protein [Sulfurovum sp.]